MDRRNFLKNSAAVAMVGGVSSAALEACSSKPSMVAGNNVCPKMINTAAKRSITGYANIPRSCTVQTIIRS